MGWKKYTGSEQSWTNDLINLEPLLTKWKRQADEASERLLTRQVISHRDMDCKNVLWDRRHRPFIIDWEAAGCTNPLQELVNVALAWSGADTEALDQERFEAVIESYVQTAGPIVDDISAALRA
ncbi:phosphotransferase [Paenibacillus allorhizosphaerae]|uniref:phosphotransferase n=1 Tax=Paenibacillus allorhizosphaerae TaxID=2849866 RepID=UPI001C408499|nr:phosphotransferase [Paenibacillus allorhizosphaerae]